jgi:hypothetical protein
MIERQRAPDPDSREDGASMSAAGHVCTSPRVSSAER